MSISEINKNKTNYNEFLETKFGLKVNNNNFIIATEILMSLSTLPFNIKSCNPLKYYNATYLNYTGSQLLKDK